MALYKEVIQDDGVTTNYHRILYLTHHVNHHNSIAVVSYVSDQARSAEQAAILAQPYQRAITYECAYDESMTIETAYEYLKTLDEFAGATDI